MWLEAGLPASQVTLEERAQKRMATIAPIPPESGFHSFCLKTMRRGKHSDDGLAMGRLASDLLNALGLIDLTHRV